MALGVQEGDSAQQGRWQLPLAARAPLCSAACTPLLLEASALGQLAGVFLGCYQKLHFSLFHFFIETERTLKLPPQQTNKLTCNDFPLLSYLF